MHEQAGVGVCCPVGEVRSFEESDGNGDVDAQVRVVVHHHDFRSGFIIVFWLIRVLLSVCERLGAVALFMSRAKNSGRKSTALLRVGERRGRCGSTTSGDH